MKDSKGLRQFLVQQMEGIADGTIDINRAKGIANLAQQIYNTLNIEIKLATSRAKLGDTFTLVPVSFDA